MFRELFTESISAEDVEYYSQLANQCKKDKSSKKDAEKKLKSAGAPKDIIADLTQGMK